MFREMIEIKKLPSIFTLEECFNSSKKRITVLGETKIVSIRTGNTSANNYGPTTTTREAALSSDCCHKL